MSKICHFKATMPKMQNQNMSIFNISLLLWNFNRYILRTYISNDFGEVTVAARTCKKAEKSFLNYLKSIILQINIIHKWKTVRTAASCLRSRCLANSHQGLITQRSKAI